jgi:heme A synthase
MHSHAGRLNQVAKLLIVLALLSVGAGAAVVSGLTPWALPVHKVVSRGMVPIAAAAVFFALRGGSPASRKTAGAGLAILPLAAFTGETAANGDAVRILHSVLAQIYALSAFLLIVFCQPATPEAGTPVPDQGWPSLRTLTVWNVLLLGSQVVLGIGVRHEFLGVLPHLIGGFFTAAIALMTGMFAMTQLPANAPVRTAAHGLLGLMLVQVMLGIGALLARMSETMDRLPAVLLTSGHTMVGAASLGAGVILAVQVFRYVTPRLRAGDGEAVAAR